MFCKKCGKEVEENVVFCPHCGIRLADEEIAKKSDSGDGDAIAGFVLGLASIVFCITIIVPILGIYFSNRGKNSSKAGFAKAGKVLSIVSLVLAIVGAAIFIGVSVSPFVTAITSKNAAVEQTVLPVGDYTSGLRETYDWYKSLGTIQTFTSDEPEKNVRVEIYLGYKKDDKATSTEITSRSTEIKEFLRRYFRGKTAAELKNPNNEEKFQMEIRNGINDKVLSESKVRAVSFHELSVEDTN